MTKYGYSQKIIFMVLTKKKDYLYVCILQFTVCLLYDLVSIKDKESMYKLFIVTRFMIPSSNLLELYFFLCSTIKS